MKRQLAVIAGLFLVAALGLVQCAGEPTPVSTLAWTAVPPRPTPAATTAAPPPAQASEPFIKIVEPLTGDALAGAAVVKGRAGGLFENTFVLELRDANGQVLASMPVTVPALEMGMAGEFQVTLLWTPPAEPTTGTLWAIYRSPKDGSVAASDYLNVMLVPAP